MKPSALTNGIILPGERRMRGGKSLNGGIWLEFDDKRIELSPDQALQLAGGILKNLGIAIEFDGPPAGSA